MSSDIRRKFGLDYLIKDKSEASAAVDKQTEVALLTVGSRVMSLLLRQAEHRVRLHELVGETGYELETLLPVVNKLESMDLVSFDERDKLGNHLISLTKQGLKTGL
jgi:hypothetical protein